MTTGGSMNENTYNWKASTRLLLPHAVKLVIQQISTFNKLSNKLLLLVLVVLFCKWMVGRVILSISQK